MFCGRNSFIVCINIIQWFRSMVRSYEQITNMRSHNFSINKWLFCVQSFFFFHAVPLFAPLYNSNMLHNEQKMYIGKLWNTFPNESSVNEPSPIRSTPCTLTSWYILRLDTTWYRVWFGISEFLFFFGFHQAVKSTALWVFQSNFPAPNKSASISFLNRIHFYSCIAEQVPETSKPLATSSFSC